MSQDIKNLKKIAAACRQAGIASYKCAEFEIILTPDAPPSNYKKRKSVSDKELSHDDVQNETQLTEEQLLFYSAADLSAEVDN